MIRGRGQGNTRSRCHGGSVERPFRPPAPASSLPGLRRSFRCPSPAPGCATCRCTAAASCPQTAGQGGRGKRRGALLLAADAAPGPTAEAALLAAHCRVDTTHLAPTPNSPPTPAPPRPPPPPTHTHTCACWYSALLPSTSTIVSFSEWKRMKGKRASPRRCMLCSVMRRNSEAQRTRVLVWQTRGSWSHWACRQGETGGGGGGQVGGQQWGGAGRVGGRAGR